MSSVPTSAGATVPADDLSPGTPGPSPSGSGAEHAAALASGPALIALATTLLAAVAAAFYTGATAPQLVADMGPVVRWGLPVLSAVTDLAAALTIAAAVLAATVLPVVPAGGHKTPLASRPAMTIVVVAASIWGVATALLSAFNFSNWITIPLDSPGFVSQLGSYLLNVSIGQGYLYTLTVAIITSLIAAAGTTINAAAWAALVSMTGLIPLALSGHAAGAGDHETAVTGLGVHVLGVSVWVGGLLVLLSLWFGLDAAGRATSVRRYSPLALWAAIAVGFGGVVSGWLRLTSFGDLFTSQYGQVLTLKTLLFVGLIAAGWQQRRRVIDMIATGEPGAFWRLASVEIAVMALALGAGAALSRSQPPAPQAAETDITLTQSLTGYPLPAPPTVSRLLFSWQPDLLWLLVAGLAAFAYLGGMLRLRRRGDAWPAWRLLLWLTGLLVMVWVTCGGPMVYGRVQFSFHMIGHMTLGMIVPFFLVLASPITLALRALPARGDGTRGPREWLIAVVDSRYSKVITYPPVAGMLFVGVLFVFYYSPLFDVALRTHVGHELMHLHFLAAGYLFFWVLIGTDPGPNRPNPALRLVFLFGVITFHAFFGISLMMSKSVLAEPFFSAVGRDWGRSLLADQQFGGGLAWGGTELPILAAAIILAVQWARSDDREARRADRRADRDGDAELAAYNAMLARAAAADERRSEREQEDT